MEEVYVEPLIEVGVALTQLAVKGTASTVYSRVKAIRDEKNTEKIRATYDEIISELLTEREEAIRIAQTYKDEVDRIKISDEDIQHLNKTVEKVLEIMKEMNPTAQLDSLDQLKELISVDTLKAIQLLGFNYKAAIGEPLTRICADAILAKSKSTTSNNYSNRNKKK